MTAGGRLGLQMRESAVRASRSSAARFVAVGGASVVIDAGLLYILHGRLQMALVPATAIAFLAGFLVNFLLNRQWSFASTGALHSQLFRYLALVLANLVVTIALVQVLTWAGVPYLVAKVATTACLSAVNYVISRKWIFM